MFSTINAGSRMLIEQTYLPRIDPPAERDRHNADERGVYRDGIPAGSGPNKEQRTHLYRM